jgi:hypothetical protein
MEAGKIGLIILRTLDLQLIKSLQENSGTCVGIALNECGQMTLNRLCCSMAMLV